MLQKSVSVGEVATSAGLARQTMCQIKDHPAATEFGVGYLGNVEVLEEATVSSIAMLRPNSRP